MSLLFNIKDILNYKIIAKMEDKNFKLGEVEIFRTMSDCFKENNSNENKTSSALIGIEEAHQRIKVTYKSPALNNFKVEKEIADLMFICNDEIHNNIRISFMQAKLKEGKKRDAVPLRKFKGDYFQWELLHERPANMITAKPNEPAAILLKNIFEEELLYRSISCFGVFYRDIYGQIDMLYAIPELVSPMSIPSIKEDDAVPSAERTFIPHHLTPYYSIEQDYCWGPLHVPVSFTPDDPFFALPKIMIYMNGINNHWIDLSSKPPEIIYTHDINKFAEYMLKGLIGLPIAGKSKLVKGLKDYIPVLKKHADSDADSEVLDKLQTSLSKLEQGNNNETNSNKNDAGGIIPTNDASGIIPTMVINITNHQD